MARVGWVLGQRANGGDRLIDTTFWKEGAATGVGWVFTSHGIVASAWHNGSLARSLASESRTQCARARSRALRSSSIGCVLGACVFALALERALAALGRTSPLSDVSRDGKRKEKTRILESHG